MAKLGSYRRIVKTDFKPEQQPLVDQLGVTINNGFEQLYDALNKKLNFVDNVSSTIVDLNVTVSATGEPLQTTVFKLDASMNNKVSGIIVLNAYGAKNAAITPTGGVFVAFTKGENQLIVNNVKGLQANILYTLKLLVL